MANNNTVSGVYNVPFQLVTGTTEVALLVPAQGVYTEFPSPLMPAGSGLTVAPPSDITGSWFDDHKFNIRLTGRIVNTGGGNVTFKMYQVPQAAVGTISATGSVTVAGAPGSGDVSFGTLVAYTTPSSGNFFVEYQLIWDSVNTKLNGYVFGQVNDSAYVAPVATTQITVANIPAMNFLPSITFATANAADGWAVSEFCIERV